MRLSPKERTLYHVCRHACLPPRNRTSDTTHMRNMRNATHPSTTPPHPPPAKPQEGRGGPNSREEKDGTTTTTTTRSSAIIVGSHDGNHHRTRGSPTSDTATTSPLAPRPRILLLTRRVGAVVNNGQGRQYHDAHTAKGDGARQCVSSGAAASGRTISLVTSAKMALGSLAASARKAQHSRHLADAHASDNERHRAE